MTCILVDHWQKLVSSVHPDDEPIFRQNQHTFNLDYPPPAYLGDVINAPVILLDANGGYNPLDTPLEFRDQSAVNRYIDLLRYPRAIDPAEISPYYAQRNYAKFIRDGKMALVNAVAYRSPSISQEPLNKSLAKILPSAVVHRMWLRENLLPQAARGERLVIAHRNSLWNLRRAEAPSGVHFSKNPVSPDLSNEFKAMILEWS
jgi:hypothetical protein